MENEKKRNLKNEKAKPNKYQQFLQIAPRDFYQDHLSLIKKRHNLKTLAALDGAGLDRQRVIMIIKNTFEPKTVLRGISKGETVKSKIGIKIVNYYTAAIAKLEKALVIEKTETNSTSSLQETIKHLSNERKGMAYVYDVEPELYGGNFPVPKSIIQMLTFQAYLIFSHFQNIANTRRGCYVNFNCKQLYELIAELFSKIYTHSIYGKFSAVRVKYFCENALKLDKRIYKKLKALEKD